jgi:quercetin dioxygenase-like cupin family protein
VEPVIHNYRDLYQPGTGAVRLINADDGPDTCLLIYSVIEPGKTSSHHIHPWEHEVYILEGSGVLVCDGKEYPIKEGDVMYIPGNVDHYTLNNQSSGNIRRIEVNPLSSANGTPGPGGTMGTGEPPIIRNYRDADLKANHTLLSTRDGMPNYVMLYNGPMVPGEVTNPATNGHTHNWQHVVYIMEGEGTLVVDGKRHTVKEGDGIMVPGNSWHQWRNETDKPMLRITFNANESELVAS